MSKPKILLQLDPDKHPSVFDSVVAIDCGIDHLLTQANVDSGSVVGLVHGTLFTRGPEDLKSTAIFFGGSNVEQTEALVKKAKTAFFGPMRVSYMSDPNGSNTTAAAAVLSVLKHGDSFGTVTVLAGTGPVGQRIASLISPYADKVRICSRTQEKAGKVSQSIAARMGFDNLEPVKTSDPAEVQIAMHGAEVVFAAGAAGIELAGEGWMENHDSIRFAIDLNAVAPAGLHGIQVMDKAKERTGKVCYGAIGVGGLKMKIHKQCIRSLFESNDKTLESSEIFEIGKSMM
jgi:hypothetical protein